MVGGHPPSNSQESKIGNGISGLLNFMFEIRRKTDGKPKQSFERVRMEQKFFFMRLQNTSGATMKVTDFGAILVSLMVRMKIIN